MFRAFMIAGTHSGAGKTTISLGLMGYLSKKYKVAPFKIGPDYIDSTYHRYVTGNYSGNLDLYMLGEKNLKSLFAHDSKEADISIIEGVMGLYDGMGTTSKGSSADVAKILKIPVILVVDGSSIAASISAIVLGYMKYDRDVNIIGVILNKIRTQGHFELLRECIERDLGIKVFGYLPRDIVLDLPSRHLGLVPTYEMTGLQEKFERLYQYIEEYIDIDMILKEVGQRDMDLPDRTRYLSPCPAKIAYACDEAFNFYYMDGLKLFEEYGAELIPFSPIHDKNLPEGISGIYIGGGFPEMFAEELSQNIDMMDSIKNAIDDGMPVYAECGGLMYLTNSIKDLDGNVFPMVGIYDADIMMTKGLKHFGYVEAEVIMDNVLFNKGSIVRGHEFHHSELKGKLRNVSYVVHKPDKNDKWSCGYVYKNCLATYVHINLYAYPDAVKGFVNKCFEFEARGKLK
ncbi:cobyrinate a,c-diamide synthase [Aceticella autotrophica]|uniref:Cobyrinate a,c-diamide synthase n=1 Tax=Aceticella autotrophica TaxID=2755338 RepID=A0A975AXJ3_9THEO|nr:cobyrinate a,c-diamide synthase [Aceticella autotrophica]QSZ28339.1 cobyrinate a,c-diamide synthase [Aceticella autotrophica]